MAALYGDYAKQTGQTAGRTSLRVGLRQNQVVARSVMAWLSVPNMLGSNCASVLIP
ncbi:MAG: hypothetical protein ACLSUZ_01785 [Bifidobacterium pseudocatenulatum]